MEHKVEARNVLVIGAGIYGLITAKTLLHDSGTFFNSVVIFEKNSELGGVWASNRIYDGLTTNSPLLTYEIPGFPYPENLRGTGKHVKAQDVNFYLQAYAERYDLIRHTEFSSHVENIALDSRHSSWTVRGNKENQPFHENFSHIVICTGLYHARHIPLGKNQVRQFSGNIWHSSELFDRTAQEMLGKSKDVVVVGAGKSAIDLATLIAQGRCSAETKGIIPLVKLVYRRPHWLSPRKILRNTIPFENLLFCRFVNAWLPYVTPPDYFHYLIAETAAGRWITRQIFKLIEDDFMLSVGQRDLPQTIPNHPLAKSLSGALHVEPPGYLDCVRSGRIEVLEGSIDSLEGREAHFTDKHGGTRVIKADNVILATGYDLALPFFSKDILQQIGLIKDSDQLDNLNDLSYIRLYRLIVPPRTIHHGQGRQETAMPYRNIAFNGFAYSLLNPTVAFVTAHWISDYFVGRTQFPPQSVIDRDITNFHAWQTACFGAHGAKGVHIGPHATLYTDQLLSDMQLRSGHVNGGALGIFGTIREWFRPMFPALYARVAADREERDRQDILKA